MLRVAAAALVIALAFPSTGEPTSKCPITLGDIVQQSTNIVQMQVTKVDREKNLIIYTEGPGPQGQAPADRDQAQHRPRRAAAGRVGRDHEVGRGRQAGRLLPQRRRQRDVHRHVVVPGLPAGRVVGHVARRAVPAPQLRRQGREAARHRRRHARRQGGGRAVHGGRRQGSDPQEDRAHPAAEGEPQAHRLQPEARLRRLGRRGHPPARRACPASTATRRSPKLDAEAQSVTDRRLRRRRQAGHLPVRGEQGRAAAERRRRLQRDRAARASPAARAPRCGPTTTATACPTCCSPRRPARGCSRTSARASSATTRSGCRRKPRTT